MLSASGLGAGRALHPADLGRNAPLAARLLARAGSSFAPQLPPFKHTPTTYAGPSAATVLEKRKSHMHPAIFHYYKKPLMVVEGKMQYVWDDTGRRYLDCFGGIVTVSVGHCHPEVVQATERQNRLLQHATTIYLHPEVAQYAEELTARMPPGLDTVYLVNSGSEANDLAMTMARLHTKSFDVIALRHCYHGGSPGTMGLTSHGTWRFPTPVGFGVHHAANPNPYRGAWAGHPDAASKYADDLSDLIRTSTPGRVAAFFHETIQGVGGAVELQEGYLKKAYSLVRQAGGLCVADEVQTGFGRTGTKYWGFENHGVVPDIVTMAKGIGNGFPMGAVVTRREIAQSMTGHIHFNTFGGNPVAAAVGRAVLVAIDDDGLQCNSLVVGGHLTARLRALQAKHSIIGDVRGRGLMLGVELVTDRTTKEPAKAETAQVLEAARDLGLLLGKGGLDGNVLRIKPPMCMTRPDADFVADVLEAVLQKL